MCINLYMHTLLSWAPDAYYQYLFAISTTAVDVLSVVPQYLIQSSNSIKYC